MRVLVQQPSTGRFYKGAQTWVADHHEALDFKNTLAAFDFCANYTMYDAQIFLCPEDAEAAVVIKPSAEFAPSLYSAQ